MDHPLLPLLATLAVLGVLAVCLRRLVPRQQAEDLASCIARLDSEGLLLRQKFHAVRAFAVEELEDEGSHYYIALADGSVLFLSGQYLYEFEVEDPDEGIPGRRFPCTEFEILRHAQEGYVLDILCAGKVLEPEAVAAPFSIQEHKDGEVPGDGERITGVSYEQLKQERLRRSAS
ncbi:hypothetical protein [Massilia sp. ST3]|uniref:hypothetical protein n=1 Tax=Massilia sp. ST3 TaxID=2824903 RepID=UPI001B839A37|nr:hypothetical protein [Massilia sp. ST3]MBQ5949041.1 hypothetical protein [Massilia sp. ST3]